MIATILITVVVTAFVVIGVFVVVDKAQQHFGRGAYRPSPESPCPSDLDVERAAFALALGLAAARTSDLDRKRSYDDEAALVWQSIPAYTGASRDVLFMLAVRKLVDQNRTVLDGDSADTEHLDRQVIDLAGMSVDMHQDAPDVLTSTER